VSMHAAVTYSHLGSWYFMEDPKPGQLVTVVFAYYQMGLQAFFMGLLFCIAGYFLPAAYDRKGAARFLRDRAVRLGVPTLFYMLVVHPFTVYVLLRNYYDIQDPGAAVVRYFTSTRWIGSSGPMWFALALLIFCAVYAAVRLLRRGTSVATARSEAPIPSTMRIVGFVLLMGLCTFLVRIVQPMGTNILNMQLCYFSQYVLLFIVGIYAWRNNWLTRLPYSTGMAWLRWALGLGSCLWLVTLGSIVATHTEDRLNGGFHWQSAAVCFWEAFFCVGISLGLIVWFRERFNSQGRFAKWMSANAFSVYLFHAPILVAITLGMSGLAAPKLAKFALATVLGCAVAFLASESIFRRIPLLRRVL